MRKESKNWKLVDDPGLFEFSESEEYLTTSSLSQELIPLKRRKDERLFREAAKSKSQPLAKFIIRTTVALYCQNCSN